MDNIKLTTYLKKLLKEVDGNGGINKDALQLVEKFVITAGANVAREASFLASGQLKGKQRTLKGDDVEAAVKICFSGEVSEAAAEDVERAVGKYKNTKGGGAATRAGLVIPPARAKTVLQTYHDGRMGADAPVALAAVMEYVGYEVLKLASRVESKKKRIDVERVREAVEGDDELSEVVMDVDWVGENTRFRSPKRIPQV